jgi:hypothetical protein
MQNLLSRFTYWLLGSLGLSIVICNEPPYSCAARPSAQPCRRRNGLRQKVGGIAVAIKRAAQLPDRRAHACAITAIDLLALFVLAHPLFR